MIIKTKIDTSKQFENLIKVGFNTFTIALDNKNSIELINLVKEKKRDIAGKIDTIDNFNEILPNFNLQDFKYFEFKSKPAKHIHKLLKSFNIKIIYTNIEATYDDDPSWIIYEIEQLNEIADYYQIEFYNDIEFPLNTILKTPNLYPNELNLSDIFNIANRYPIILSVKLKNILEYNLFFKKTFSKIQGINVIFPE